MENLIAKLDSLWQTEFIYTDASGIRRFTNEARTVREICRTHLYDYVTDLLLNYDHIVQVGSPNFDNIEILRNHGYDVYAAEEHAFGWIIGCISKNNKTLVF